MNTKSGWLKVYHTLRNHRTCTLFRRGGSVCCSTDGNGTLFSTKPDPNPSPVRLHFNALRASRYTDLFSSLADFNSSESHYDASTQAWDLGMGCRAGQPQMNQRQDMTFKILSPIKMTIKKGDANLSAPPSYQPSFDPL